MAQEENVPRSNLQSEVKTNDDKSPFSRRTANIILYCIVTGLLGLLVGIVFYAYNKIPPQIVTIVTTLGGLIAFISTVVGTIIANSFSKAIRGIWSNANRNLMLLFGVLTVLFLTLAVLLAPIIPYRLTITSVTSQANTPASAVTSQANTPTTAQLTTSNPYGGTLVYDDPLSDNSKGYDWQVNKFVSKSGEPLGCAFVKGAYHVQTAAGGYFMCTAQSSDRDNLDNFAFEVRTHGSVIFRWV
jgi:hypothetical protein